MSILLGGTDDYARCSSGAPVTDYGANGVTIAGWFKFTGAATTLDTICSVGVAGALGPSLALLYASTGAINAYCHDGTANSNCNTTNELVKLTDTDWHHAVAIFPSNNDRISVLDGDWVNRGEVVDGAARNLSGVDSVTIGCQGDGTSSDFAGNVGHVSVWNTVLTQAQVESLAAGANPLTIQAANLVAYWPLTDSGDLGNDAKATYDLTSFVGSASYSALEPTVDAATEKYVKVLAESSAASESSLEVVVHSAPSGSNYVTGTTRYGSTNGQAFEATLEAGEAVLFVPAADVGCSSLPVDTAVAACARNTTYTTGMVAATIVEV